MQKIRLDNIFIANAVGFAIAAHHGQRRKYTNEPYITHPVAVGQIIRGMYPKTTTNMIVAAVLHDVVEDTQFTNDDIKEHFGERVAELVYWVTDQSKPEDGNRADRKKIDREHIWAGPVESQVIKLADLIHNTGSIVEHDKDFARIYLPEKSLILEGLRPEVKELELFAYADAQINQGMSQILPGEGR